MINRIIQILYIYIYINNPIPLEYMSWNTTELIQQTIKFEYRVVVVVVATAATTCNNKTGHIEFTRDQR